MLIKLKIKFSESVCSSCIDGINHLTNGNQSLREQIKILKSKYVDALAENFKKDYTLDKLKKQLNQSTPPDTMTQTPSDSTEPNPNYSKLLSEEQLEKCRCISNVKSTDSKFILTAVRGLYATNLEIVKEKSVLGRKKQPISPEKYSLLKDLLGNRLKTVDEQAERASRMSKLNTHINSAFGNISKSLRK